jgi:hypothetical protein
MPVQMNSETVASILKLYDENEKIGPVILEKCCGSGMFIPDPTFFHPGFELSPSWIRIKTKKWFLQ